MVKGKRLSRRLSRKFVVGSGLSDEERLRLIRRAFLECGVKASKEKVEEQFRYETGRKPR